VLCEAATGAPTHGRIEVGVTTAEAHRQRGFATITCATLIALCEAQGYGTWWDCAKQNTPSARLARKLGYQNQQEYRYVWWAKH
jgi:RimJ/RimL family protein N-acetyltransferase